MIKKHTRLVLSLAISFIILVVLFRNTSFAEVLNLIEKADFRIILIAFVISIFNGVFISSLRWKLILDKMDCDISWKESLFVKVASEPKHVFKALCIWLSILMRLMSLMTLELILCAPVSGVLWIWRILRISGSVLTCQLMVAQYGRLM